MQRHFRFYVQNCHKYGPNCLPAVSVLLDFEEVSRLDKCSYTGQDFNKVSPTTETIRLRSLRKDLFLSGRWALNFNQRNQTLTKEEKVCTI